MEKLSETIKQPGQMDLHELEDARSNAVSMSDRDTLKDISGTAEARAEWPETDSEEREAYLRLAHYCEADIARLES